MARLDGRAGAQKRKDEGVVPERVPVLFQIQRVIHGIEEKVDGAVASLVDSASRLTVTDAQRDLVVVRLAKHRCLGPGLKQKADQVAAVEAVGGPERRLPVAGSALRLVAVDGRGAALSRRRVVVAARRRTRPVRRAPLPASRRPRRPDRGGPRGRPSCVVGRARERREEEQGVFLKRVVVVASRRLSSLLSLSSLLLLCLRAREQRLGAPVGGARVAVICLCECVKDAAFFSICVCVAKRGAREREKEESEPASRARGAATARRQIRGGGRGENQRALLFGACVFHDQLASCCQYRVRLPFASLREERAPRTTCRREGSENGGAAKKKKSGAAPRRPGRPLSLTPLTPTLFLSTTALPSHLLSSHCSFIVHARVKRRKNRRGGGRCTATPPRRAASPKKNSSPPLRTCPIDANDRRML